MFYGIPSHTQSDSDDSTQSTQIGALWECYEHALFSLYSDTFTTVLAPSIQTHLTTCTYLSEPSSNHYPSSPPPDRSMDIV